MLFDRPYTRGRTHISSFDLVTLVWPHSRWEWQAIIPSSPVVTIVFYHAMEVSCYHSFWAVKSRLCLRLVTLGLSWQSWMSACRNKGQNNWHVFVGATCRQHVGRHVGKTTQKAVGKGTAGVGPTCHLLTCWPSVVVMSTDMCSSCQYVATMLPTCRTSINQVEKLIYYVM